MAPRPHRPAAVLRTRRRIDRATRAAVVVILVAASGCRWLGSSGRAVPQIPLAVRNNGFLDVNVFTVQSGGSNGARLGTVTGNSTATFHVRTTDLQAGDVLVVRVRAIGSNRSWLSPGVTVGPDVMAMLEVSSDASGNLTRSMLYTTMRPDTSSQGR